MKRVGEVFGRGEMRSFQDSQRHVMERNGIE